MAEDIGIYMGSPFIPIVTRGKAGKRLNVNFYISQLNLPGSNNILSDVILWKPTIE